MWKLKNVHNIIFFILQALFCHGIWQLHLQTTLSFRLTKSTRTKRRIMWSQKLCFGRKWATLKPCPCPWPAPWLSSKRGTNITLQFGPRINISGWDSLASLSPLPWRDSQSNKAYCIYCSDLADVSHILFFGFSFIVFGTVFENHQKYFETSNEGKISPRKVSWR